MYAMVSPLFITCFNRFVQSNPHCNIMIVNNKKITKHTKQVNIILPEVAWDFGASLLGKRGVNSRSKRADQTEICYEQFTLV